MGEWRARIYSLFREQLTCCCDHHTMQWLNKWSSGNSFWVLHSSLGLNKSRSVIKRLRIFFFVFVLLVLLIDLSENPSIFSWLCYQFNTLKRICNLFVVQYESWCCILSSLQVQNLHKKQLNLGLCSSLVCIAMRCYCELYSALMWELYKLKQWNSLIKDGRNATSSSFLTKICKTQKSKLADAPGQEI